MILVSFLMFVLCSWTDFRLIWVPSRLERRLKCYGCSGLSEGGPEANWHKHDDHTSNINIKTSNMQESKHTKTPGCKIKKRADAQVQNEAATLAAVRPGGPVDLGFS